MGSAVQLELGEMDRSPLHYVMRVEGSVQHFPCRLPMGKGVECNDPFTLRLEVGLSSDYTQPPLIWRTRYLDEFHSPLASQLTQIR